jgi:serine protease Do
MRVVSGKQTDPLEFVNDWTGWRQDLGYEVMTNLPWRFMVQSAINGGNSGGPSFNSRGEVIGLNHAGWPAGQGLIRQNENYTIPINFVKNFVTQIMNTGKYELPWVGIDILVPKGCDTAQAVSDFVDRHYNPKVATVLGVRYDSPAEHAGFKKGDVIISFDGQTFPTNSDLRMYIFSLPIGKQVPVVVKRGERKVELLVDISPKRTYDSEFSL